MLLSQLLDLWDRDLKIPFDSSRDFVETHPHEQQQEDLKHTPANRNAAILTRATVLNNKRQTRAGNQTSKMGSVVDKEATNETNEEINQYDGKHPRAESALESIGQLVTELDTKNEQHTNQP